MQVKTLSLFIAACGIATASLAQSAVPSKQVKIRDNGTKKTTTVHADGSTTVVKTGKTNLGAMADLTVNTAGNVAEKTVVVVREGARKVSGATKSGTHKAESGTD